MNEKCKNLISQTEVNLRWFRTKLPASKSPEASSHMRSETEAEEIAAFQSGQEEGDAYSGNVVSRIVANPCETKTQVAKITYSSDFSKTSSPVVSSPRQSTQEDFRRMREEPEKEMAELHSQLKEISNKPCTTSEEDVIRSAITVNSSNVFRKDGDKITTAPSSYHRSKTEGVIIKPMNATARAASSFELDVIRDGEVSSKQSEFLKSQENLRTDSTCSRRRAYDPAEARRFIKEQKKKRRANFTANAEQKTAYEKEQIKKRLEDLRKSSRLIITKNLKKNRSQNFKQSKQTMLSSPGKLSDKANAKNAIASRSTFGATVDFLTKKSENTKSKGAETNQKELLETDLMVSKSAGTGKSEQLKSHRSSSSGKTPRSASINEKQYQRRVGLLRKPETKDHSFSAIKEFSFDKENVALEMLTPKIPCLSNHKGEGNEAYESQKSSCSECTAKSMKKTDEYQEKPEISIPNAESNRNKLEPPTQYTPENYPAEKKEEKCTQVDDNPSLHVNSPEPLNVPKEESDLPYWLRPSTVQIYPYNFIQAVRRKIEAIVEPGPKDESNSNQHKTTPSRSYPTKVSEGHNKIKTAIETKANQSVPPVEISFVNIEKPDQDVDENVGSNRNTAKSQTLSDFNSNLSSISLQMPPSDTVSGVSSIKLDSALSIHSKSYRNAHGKISVNHDDDTTASSSVFSSPEKRHKTQTISKSHKEISESVSPLSLERVDQLKIVSKRSPNIDYTTDVESHNSDNVDFNKLLSDFNHGLSQVIEANEQLKSTLDRSQQILSPSHISKVQSSGTTTYEVYTTDFEDLSQSNLTSLVVTRHSEAKSVSEHQSKRKRKLFKVATPLLSSPKPECENEIGHDPDPPSKPLVPEFEINLSSITPSSVGSSELTTSETTTGTTGGGRECSPIEEIEEELTPQSDPISPQTHEEQLARIDKLKENLRRMINDSEAQRRFADHSGRSSSTSTEKKTYSSYKTTSVKHTETPKSLSPSTSQSQMGKGQNYSSPEISNKKKYSENSSVASNTYVISPSNDTHGQRTLSHSSASKAAHSKSRTLESTSHVVIEDLLQTHESPSMENKSENIRKPRAQKKLTKEDHGSHVQSHINTSRGDYTPENHKSLRSTGFRHSHHPLSPQKPSDYRNEFSSINKKKKSPSSVETVTTTTTTTSRKSEISEIVTTLRISDLEISRVSSCEGSISESSLNYSNVGLYEQLIKTETTKSEYLKTLLKMREKAILDRTKGQIAWLEVQKERYKSKGLMLQIAAIRKKQRAILLKMEKEREEIKRILQTTQSTSSEQATSRLKGGCIQDDTVEQLGTTKTPPPILLPTGEPLPTLHNHRRHPNQRDRSYESLCLKPSSAPILRASYELETSASLERLLRQREEDLRKRREYVERLMEWHRKLDQEEAEVLNLERMLFSYNACLNEQNKKVTSVTSETRQLEASGNSVNETRLSPTIERAGLAKRAHEMERRLKEIDKSLRDLNNISATTTQIHQPLNSHVSTINGQDANSEENQDFVRTTGNKLNKLWRRLTSQHVEKFEPNRRYKLCKSDLERLYEEAKRAVLSDFAHAEERSLAVDLLDRSASNVSAGTFQSQASFSSIGSAGDILNAISSEGSSNIVTAAEVFNCVRVPNLNLNFSTSQSEEQEEEHSKNTAGSAKKISLSKRCTKTGDYSPSAAERNFQTQSSKSPSPSKTDGSSPDRDRSELIKRNMRKFLRLTSHPSKVNSRSEGLERSLSDTQLASPSISDHHKSGASQCSLWAAHQNENKFHLHASKRESPKPSVSNEVSADTLQSVASLKTISDVSTATYDSTASNIVETVNIPTSSGHLVTPNHENNREASPISSTEKIQTRVSETSRGTKSESEANEFETNESVERATEIRSVGVPTVSYSSKSAVTNGTTAPSISETQRPENDMNHSSTVHEETTTDFESKSNEIAAKLNEISEAVARLSHPDSLSSRKNSSSAHQSDEISSQETRNENSTNSLTNKQLSYISSFESPVTTAKTSHSPKLQQTALSPLSQSDKENRLLDDYELDFESSSNETLLEDVSMPRLDTTFDVTVSSLVSEEVDDPVVEVQKSESNENLCGEVTQREPETSTPNGNSPGKLQTVIPPNTVECSRGDTNNPQQLMPDIINELEIRRCQQILLESEQLRQYEHVTAVPYMYVREIPNKPPPPYCPPAHGSPMTTIFPSEDRIKDITYRRTHELYCEILKTDHVDEKGEKLPSVLDEQITNIYERIILDICREYLDEHHEVLTQGDPANFRSQLAFFNPPDRLRCIQESIYKEVRRCLAMDKTSPKRNPVYSIYGQRARRDHIGKIIIQEMYEEDEKWCNFHHEEDEVLELIIEEMIENDIGDIAKIVLVEEGGLLSDKANEAADVLQYEQNLEVSQNAENEIVTMSEIRLDEMRRENLSEGIIVECTSNEKVKV